MRITNVQTAEVYRSTKDRFGDKMTETHVGTIEGCSLQPSTGLSLNYQQADAFQETSSLSAILYAPRGAAILLEPRDRLDIDGVRYAVVSPRAWDHPSATGRSFSHYAVQVEVVE